MITSGRVVMLYQEVHKADAASGIDEVSLSLVGHDLYGSSRLGTKTYWPTQVGIAIDQYRQAYDTVRLWERRPWYSLEYQNMITDTARSPYGNTFVKDGLTTHLTGQKQYELSDHLGNVTATVSDARATTGFAGGAGDSFGIAGYSPVVQSMHDYFPYGMPIPGRSFEANSTNTTTVTKSVLAPYTYPYP